jgi:hypothetical protein
MNLGRTPNEVRKGKRRFFDYCCFCGGLAVWRLPSGPYMGWLTCGAENCGLRQIKETHEKACEKAA